MEKKANPGYHIYEITRGVYGEFSKVQEEFMEVKDAWEQQSPIMALVEISDLLGAMEAYYGEAKFNQYYEKALQVMIGDNEIVLDLEAKVCEAFDRLNARRDDEYEAVMFIATIDFYIAGYNMTLADVMIMNHITKRAFRAGRRTPNT